MTLTVLQVTDNKQRIGELKALIEQRRVKQSMASLNDPGAVSTSQEADAVEEEAKAAIEQVCSTEAQRAKSSDPHACGHAADALLVGQGHI